MNATPKAPDQDLYAAVRPTGWLGDVLSRVGNPRKHRWNLYRRACRAIPESSPVSGSTSFKRINERRLALIEAAHRTGAREPLETDPEYLSLNKAAGAWLAGPMVVSNFLMQRELHRLERLHGKSR